MLACICAHSCVLCSVHMYVCRGTARECVVGLRVSQDWEACQRKARGLEEYVCYVMWWRETLGTPSRIAKTAVDCCVMLAAACEFPLHTGNDLLY